MTKSPVEAKRESGAVANLIERLEKATGPDREIDRAIFEAACLEDQFKHFDAESWFCSLDCGSYGFNTGREPATIWCGALPTYTGSIDAALTLVPNGLEWVANNRGMKRQPGCTEWNGWAGIYGEPFIGSENDSYGATPAIALCIAALTARMTAPPNDAGGPS